MSLKTRAILVVFIGLIMGVSLSVGGGLASAPVAVNDDDLTLEQARLFLEVMERVKADDVAPIGDAELMESAIRGMVRDLDAQSQYLDAEEYRDIRVSTTGSYTGIGVEVAEVEGRIHVVTPILGSPAARSGVRSGDVIVAVDDVVVDPERLQDTIGRMRGRPGSRISVTVEREGEHIIHSMRRETVRVASVYSELLAPAYGYVRVGQFNESTAREVSRAIDDLAEENEGLLTGLVLDLRNNPGGVLDSAVDVSDLFLDAGVIVSADGRSAESRFTRSAHHGDILDGSGMVVLVNEGSASASEIVAGALQDHGRALVLGTNTFGKGLVQTVMPLSKGRAIKLTTSHYYTPSGDSIHGTGITPDIYVTGTDGHPSLSLSGLIDREADAQLVEALQRLESPGVMHSLAE